MNTSVALPPSYAIKSGSGDKPRQGNDVQSFVFHQFLRTRRSIRRFQPDPVPDAVLQDILTTTLYAPSAHHRQPWRFVLLQDAENRSKLATAMAVDFERDMKQDGIPPAEIQSQLKRSTNRIISAPTAILLCLEMSEMDQYPDPVRSESERTMAVQSVAAAALQFLLAAHAEGLGAVWACWPLFAGVTIRSTLRLPETWEPQAIFFVGYPQRIPDARVRKPLSALVITR